MQRENYPRISDILGVWTRAFLDKIPQETLANAANRGTRVHLACLGLMQGIWNPNALEEDMRYVQSFERYISQKPPYLLKAETRLYCDELCFSGQFDFVWKEGGDLWLVDVKTSANESPTWRYQIAAYFYLCQKNALPVDKAKVLKLSKTGGKAKVIEYPNVQEDFKVVKQCVELYHLFNPRKE